MNTTYTRFILRSKEEKAFFCLYEEFQCNLDC